LLQELLHRCELLHTTAVDCHFEELYIITTAVIAIATQALYEVELPCVSSREVSAFIYEE
jgi:hypothetical protein